MFLKIQRSTLLFSEIFYLFCALSLPTFVYGQERSPSKWTPSASEIQTLKQQANAGDSNAQNTLGMDYWDGRGVKQDYVKALIWLEESATKGSDANAENYLGIAYTYGVNGKKRDVAKAAEWFKKSALGGDSYAQENLGHFYYRGIGVKKDCHEAKYWLDQSVSQENAEGERSLGYLYERGKCVEKNTEMALDLYQKSCSHGLKISCDYYEELNAS